MNNLLIVQIKRSKKMPNQDNYDDLSEYKPASVSRS